MNAYLLSWIKLIGQRRILNKNVSVTNQLNREYSTHPLIRTRKGLSFLFELANVRIIGNSEKTKNFDVPSHVLYSYNIHTTCLQLLKKS